MSSPVIRVEDLSKLYRLGEVGTGSLAHDINRWWHRIRGREDPYTQVGRVNDRTRAARKKSEGGKQNADDSDYVWALKDINFEVSQGEVLGIIGRNGAGKSTLLKILSRVTAPTSGQVKVRGRIASLLEVGTGFHPELTGRENVYLNGAVLGMRKNEIDRKLDAIVDFSGCAAYIDTPVKRYSSGMQVRLAFAVAAHLEPEILIVDEVLAVGDIDFQQKCLGQMRSHSAMRGRTVLFVSHDLNAVRSLCPRTLILGNGEITKDTDTATALDMYRGIQRESGKHDVHLTGHGVGLVSAHCAYSADESQEALVRIELRLSFALSSADIFVDVALETESSIRVVQHVSRHRYGALRITHPCSASFDFETRVPLLLPGAYSLTVYVYERLGTPLLHISGVPAFRVEPMSGPRECADPGYTALVSPRFTLATQVHP